MFRVRRISTARHALAALSLFIWPALAAAEAVPDPAVSAPAVHRHVAPLDVERIAARVFDLREGGAHVGLHFVRMPDGRIFQRERKPSVEDHSAIAREMFRLSIQIKLAERQLWLKDARKRREEARSQPRAYERKPLAFFFNDDTLSAGDVVVAVEGFRVFKGSPNFPWRAADFVPLEAWRSQNGSRRGLREMERESQRRGL